ncbi:MAG: sulfurtransferase TusA family protein [Chloroflexi bacterium]|nr:sulfurtransferase TusA family protein [Chloroflexota bacterium]
MPVITEYDLSGFICPISKVRATQVINNLDEGETVKIILGDRDSLKNVVIELKARGLKPDFQQEDENKFALTVSK